MSSPQAIAKPSWLAVAWAWIVKAFQDAYAFAYTEIGHVLSVFKTPDQKKYSGKRVIAIALVADLLLRWQLPASVWGWIYVIAKLAVAGGLYALAELTKT